MCRVFKSCILVTVLVNSLSVSLPLFLEIKIALDVWSVESREVLIDVPFELGVAQVKNALGMRSIKVKPLVKGFVFDIEDI